MERFYKKNLTVCLIPKCLFTDLNPNEAILLGSYLAMYSENKNNVLPADDKTLKSVLGHIALENRYKALKNLENKNFLTILRKEHSQSIKSVLLLDKTTSFLGE